MYFQAKNHISICLFALLIVTIIKGVNSSSVRQRRSVVELSDVIKHITGWSDAYFVKYGNHCGVGGGGEVVDEIDRCCQMHDVCWGYLEMKGCLQNWGVTYKWKPLEYDIYCYNGTQPYCAAALCECDREVSNCFRMNLDVYDLNNVPPCNQSTYFFKFLCRVGLIS